MIFKKKKKIQADFRERDPHVQIIVITRDNVEPECMTALQEQDYPDFGIAIHSVKPKYYHSNGDLNGVFNCVRNHNIARRMALATDAGFFFLVDSDVVLPKNALSNLVLHRKDMISGWYPTRLPSPFAEITWPTAVMNGNTAMYFDKPQHSLVMADFTGIGCLLVSRQLYERVEHRESVHKSMPTNFGKDVFVDDSSQFCFDSRKLGYQLYMNGDVICEHLTRKNSKSSYELPKDNKNVKIRKRK